MARAGAPFELIARQLRHRDVAMGAKVTADSSQDTEERDRWGAGRLEPRRREMGRSCCH